MFFTLAGGWGEGGNASLQDLMGGGIVAVTQFCEVTFQIQYYILTCAHIQNTVYDQPQTMAIPIFKVRN